MTVFSAPAPDLDSLPRADHARRIKSAPAPDSGGTATFVFNAVWDPGGPTWVVWATSGASDPSGTFFPNPYGTGFGGCTGYREIGRG